MSLDVENIDLAAVAAALSRLFEDSPPRGYVRGRTLLRDAVAKHLDCSIVDAERLIDTMVGRGFLRFDGDPSRADGTDAAWVIARTR
jgi:hypothetical protein